MRSTYVFDGRLKARAGENFTGLMDVYITENSISVHPKRAGSGTLQIAPFHGGMFFGPWEHRQVDDIFEKGYELDLSGTAIGHYATGGGPDGDFTIFRLKNAKIRGTFGPPGLSVTVHAQTWPASSVCYALNERRENVYEPIEVAMDCIVPPKYLVDFMMLRISLDHEIFARFKWNQT